MKIHLFNDGTGTIHGIDARNLTADRSGKLRIGSQIIPITPARSAPFPAMLDAHYSVTFTADDGMVYKLGRIGIHNGGIVAAKDYTAREIELRHALDSAEDRISELTAKVEALEKIFDTDSLNFILTTTTE